MTPLDRARARKIIDVGFPIGPRMHPCICSAPRHAHSGTKWTGGHEPTGCRRYRRDGADALAEKVMEADHSDIIDDIGVWHAATYPRPVPADGGLGIGPSDLGRCGRQIQYRERPPADLYTNEVDHSAAVLGSIWHAIIQRARQHRYPWRKFEFEVEIPGLDRPGRMDEFDPIMAVGVDWKTVSDRQWEVRGQQGEKEEHFQQLAVYCYALTQLGYEVRVMRLIYVNRESGQSEYIDRPYSERYAKDALAELTATALAIDLGQELPRDGRGPDSGDYMCEHLCQFRDYCWNVPQAVAAGRSPVSYTIIGPNPEEPAITWAAEQVRDWGDNKAEADREYKAAKPLLGGIPDGTYGDYVIKGKSRQMPQYKQYYEQVMREYDRYLNTPEPERGDFIDWIARIPLTHRKDAWPEVKRVRATQRKENTTP